jgi:putative Mg2+ transporter-C (MgtC) family protein
MLGEEFQNVLIKLAISLLIGSLIGGEREYRNKSAGLRTIMLICLGSTIFTIISLEVSHETEVGRIASNIVTGIGFLGAGAIMRDGLSISGLTTASTIWVAAALGMAVGFGEFTLAITATVIALVVLIVFNYFQRIFDRLHKTMDLYVTFDIDLNDILQVEEKMNALKIRYTRKKERREEGTVKYDYELSGKGKNVDALIEYLVEQKEKIISFEY